MAGKRNRATYEADLQAVKSPYVFYGTPLPSLDSKIRDDGSFVPIWKQEVTDERGRKRLHGAFTGGFSAGYFNTVGSKEGWAPATFVSSKKNRWKDGGNKSQQVEDIMDEEDKAEAEESRHISTQSKYGGLGSTADEVNNRAPLMDLFRPSNDTMGFNLLRKMGWKDGQGVGPRVLREAILNEGTPSGRPSTEKHLFAPKNSKLILIVRKSDRKGLGYRDEAGLERPLTRSPDRSDEDSKHAGKSKSQKSKKSSFGVGILNDTGSDDEDPFSLGPNISYSKTLGGDKKKKKKPIAQLGSNSNPLLNKRPVFVSVKANKALAGFRKCHDGRLPLEGFLLSISKSPTEINKYPPPKVPDGWKPSKLGADSKEVLEWQSSADLAKSSKLEPSMRGTILGEAPLPGKSVFDFIKPEGRARLVSLTQNESLPPAGSETAPLENTASDPASQIPSLDPSIASSALGRGVGGFIPYTDNPTKLARYRAYLSYSAGLGTDIPTRPAELPREEWIREMQEFAHAATIFKPMTGSIATRFTSASTASLQPQSSNQDENNLVDSSKSTAKDPAEEAAALSMFGHLTRSSMFFYPSRLLCKRFNVPVPSHVHSGNEGSSTAKSGQYQQHPSNTPFAPEQAPEQIPVFANRFQSSGYQTADDKEPMHVHIASDTLPESRSVTTEDINPGSGSDEKTQAMNSAVKLDPDRNEALEKDRPGDDVFKAIFGSDSEDE